MKRGIIYCCDRRAGELMKVGGEFVVCAGISGPGVLSIGFGLLAPKDGCISFPFP